METSGRLFRPDSDPEDDIGGRRVNIERVPIDSLVVSESPRISGEDSEHIRVLAEFEGVLPPILVHRPTMRVIDGMHRLRAAVLSGEKDIDVRFEDGTNFDMFVSAVEANTVHGLGLSWVDRLAAVRRILTARPKWSDPKVAAVVGLSGKTVNRCRRHLADTALATNREEWHGPTRHTDSLARRRLAAEMITERPDAAAHEVAGATGLSPDAVLDMKARIRAVEDACPSPGHVSDRPDVSEEAEQAYSDEANSRCDPAAILRSLHCDPLIRYSDAGRALLHWLTAHVVTAEEWQDFVGIVPAHWAGTVAELARNTGDAWIRFAELVEQGGATANTEFVSSRSR
jgi:ParB-like chromosome segregation protein Spo0J